MVKVAKKPLVIKVIEELKKGQQKKEVKPYHE